MAGLNLASGLRFRASTANTTAAAPNTGSVNYAAFSPGATQSMQSRGSVFNLGTPFGMAFATGVGCTVILALIRHSLPK